MVSWWVPYLPKGCRPDFNNGLGGDSNSGPVLAPRRLFESDSNNGPCPGHSNLVSDEVHISVQVSYLWFPGGYNDFSTDVTKQIRVCLHLHENLDTVDVVGSVNTIRLRPYGWNTSKDWCRWVSQHNKAWRRWVSQHNKAKTLGMRNVDGRKFTEKNRRKRKIKIKRRIK